MRAKAIVEKVALLPAVEVCIEHPLELQVRSLRRAGGGGVHGEDGVEGRFVERTAHGPRFVPVGPQILLAHVLHPDQPLHRIVLEDAGHGHALLGKKPGDVDVVPVFLLLAGVFHKNHRAGAVADAVEIAVGASFFQGNDLRGELRCVRKPRARERNDVLPCDHRNCQRGRCRIRPHWGQDTSALSERRARLVCAVTFIWHPEHTSCSTVTTARAFLVSKSRS